MIELPEAAVIARQIATALTGRQIVDAVANASPHKFAWYTGDPANYKSLLPGKTIRGASAYGNHIEVRADELKLVISTAVKYHAKGEDPPKKHQLFLAFDDGSTATCTVQMWGVMLIIEESGEGALPDYLVAKQKPSPLSESFDLAYFVSLIHQAKGSLSAKEFLATKQRIPGLGNGVLQDILWAARIHPKRKMSDLSEVDIDAMFDAVKLVLSEMTEQGGRDTERDLFNCPGGYRTILSKNTVGAPCQICGTPLRKESYLGGAIYLCEGCQGSKI
jgi:formamidopyrimidine-DNA glycosylase